MDNQALKAAVLAHHEALDAARPGEALDALRRHCAEGMTWKGVHPWNEVRGLEALATEFWEPLRAALGPLQRRPDVLFAGQDVGRGRSGGWACEMGHLLGLWDRPWLGLRPTRKMAFLRYCEWSRVESGRVVEQALFLDLEFLMHQAGAFPYARATGAVVLTPGPRTHDGLLLGPQDPGEGEATATLIQRMLRRLTTGGVLETRLEDLPLDWHPGMIWWGPSGIGASYTFERYLEQHCRPFEAGNRYVDDHGADPLVAEGRYGGVFGYPAMLVQPLGGYLGVAGAQDRPVEMRLTDIYRREGDKLAENWIFIDHLHVMAQLGNDLLGRMAAAGG